MLNDRCPVCGETIAVASRSVTLSNCPGCGAFLGECPEGVTAATLPGAPAPGALTASSTPVLEEEFKAGYELCEMLGRGAAGVVFSAVQRSTRRVVAIKFLTRFQNESQAQRFLQEGRLLAGIQHPNVLRVIDLGRSGGHPFLVTALLPGGTLRKKLRAHGALPPKEAMAIALDCLDGLEALHSRTIIHRDVKPDNIIFDEAGRAVVTDLGLAKDLMSGSNLTRTGAMLGTPAYMAPEQVVGDPASAASDVYAMGLILYEMLRGRHPFEAGNLGQLFHLQLNAPAPPLDPAECGVSPQVSDAVARALSKEPDRRFPTAGAFAVELRAGSRRRTAPAAKRKVTPTPSAPPDERRRSKDRRRAPAWLWVAGAGAALGLALGMLTVRGPGHPRPSSRGASPVTASPPDRPPAPGDPTAARARAVASLVAITTSIDRFERTERALKCRLDTLATAVEALLDATPPPGDRSRADFEPCLGAAAVLSRLALADLEISQGPGGGRSRQFWSGLLARSTRELSRSAKDAAVTSENERVEAMQALARVEEIPGPRATGAARDPAVARALAALDQLTWPPGANVRLGSVWKRGALARQIYLMVCAEWERSGGRDRSSVDRVVAWLTRNVDAFSNLSDLVWILHELFKRGTVPRPSDPFTLDLVSRSLAGLRRGTALPAWLELSSRLKMWVHMHSTITGPPDALAAIHAWMTPTGGGTAHAPGFPWSRVEKLSSALEENVTPLSALACLAVSDLGLRHLEHAVDDASRPVGTFKEQEHLTYWRTAVDLGWLLAGTRGRQAWQTDLGRMTEAYGRVMRVARNSVLPDMDEMTRSTVLWTLPETVRTFRTHLEGKR